MLDPLDKKMRHLEIVGEIAGASDLSANSLLRRRPRAGLGGPPCARSTPRHSSSS